MYLIAWRVSQVQDTLEKPGYRPSLVLCERMKPVDIDEKKHQDKIIVFVL